MEINIKCPIEGCDLEWSREEIKHSDVESIWDSLADHLLHHHSPEEIVNVLVDLQTQSLIEELRKKGIS